MNWAIAAHISPKNGCIHNSKFPSAGNVHGNKNYTFPQCKYCLHIADFHQPTSRLRRAQEAARATPRGALAEAPLPFFAGCQGRGRPAGQDAGRVSQAAGVHGPSAKLLRHGRRWTSRGLRPQAGATRTVLRAAAGAWRALTGLPRSDASGALTGGAVQHWDEHGASPCCGCCVSSHHGGDPRTSTPLRHLRRC
jgi:hypothetical protein